MASYKSPYKKQLQAATDAILNRQKFSYDFNADQLYNLYKTQYMQQGNIDMRNAIGDMSSLTGGMASSAATAAGSTAYNANISALNAKIPELYNTALNQYNAQTQDLYNQFNMLNTLDNTSYSRYRDTVSDSYADKNYNLQLQQLNQSASNTAASQALKSSQLQAQMEYDAKKKQYGL